MLGLQGDLSWVLTDEEGLRLIPSGTPPDKELILLSPYVVRSGGAKWHNCVIRMYLDNFSAIFMGNPIYAYAKQLATLAKLGTKTKVTESLLDVFNCDIVSTSGESEVGGQSPRHSALWLRPGREKR